MIHLIKSEFLRLFTIRSTYFIMGLSFFTSIFFSFYINGYKGLAGSGPDTPDQPILSSYSQLLLDLIGPLSLFLALIVILFVAHEYRYNTITYTLTTCVNRTKILIAKALTVLALSILFVLILSLFNILCYKLGLALRDPGLSPSLANLMASFGKALFYGVGLSIFAFLLATATRSIIFAVIFIFMAPNTLEPLLGLVLKDNAVYLPFSALSQVLTTGQPSMSPGVLSVSKAMVVFLIYIVVGSAITWILFKRRDAN